MSSAVPTQADKPLKRRPCEYEAILPVGIAQLGSSCSSSAASTQQATKRRKLSLSKIPRVARSALPLNAASPQLTGQHKGSLGASALLHLACGPYLDVVAWLWFPDLGRLDASCRLLRVVNRGVQGPWHAIGHRAFHGMELEVGGSFLAFQSNLPMLGAAELTPPSNGNARFSLFHREVATFSPPFSGREICKVGTADEVAYCRCRLRTDVLAMDPKRSIFLEVEVQTNADNLSLAVVDFESGGKSSVTFSPETGAILRERKVQEAPRVIQGTYIHLLEGSPQGCRFEGSMGLFLHSGHLAFYRRWQESEAWETTGYCTDLKWAEGSRLSLCLAFRDAGEYCVRIKKVSDSPPHWPHTCWLAYEEANWHRLFGDESHPLAI